ncbi:MAG: hypothetical protein ABJP76_09740 [Flavobacteriaceae bacterium]
MKKAIVLFFVFAIGACKKDIKKQEVQERVDDVTVQPIKKYPKSLKNIFDAHGGLETWKEQRTLTYTLSKGNFNEVHTVDLWYRKDRVAAEQFSLGYDGAQVWLLDPDKKYRGDAAFYHNLMFYFYAMPFVLADDGIIYSHTQDLVYDGQNYPGIRISYKSGVGTTSKDEYFIHYDSKTNQMAWLGYTVTYRTGEKSKTIKWIRYNDWQEIEEVLLPKSITWHNFEGAKVLDARRTVQFENSMLSTISKPDAFYAKPEKGTFVAVKKN